MPIAALTRQLPPTSKARRIGLLSTYPPKLCGLATFAAALERALLAAGHTVEMIRINDGDAPVCEDRPGLHELANGVPASLTRTAALLSRCDVAIIQHEYGIFGGPDGDEVLDLLKAIDVPTIVTLHTVPVQPSPHQREVLEAVCHLANSVIVMAETAKNRLTAMYRVDRTKVHTVPHGAASLQNEPASRTLVDVARPQLLTWGLLGPGKGIEHAIDALEKLRNVRPRPRYTVAGVTHPKVFAREGDRYRRSLMQRASVAGIGASVTFDDTYRDVRQLTHFIASASVVILPYDSRDQVTSGVLVDAIAAGRPVIATAFPHALELLGSGAGIVVPHGDPVAMAEAIRDVVSDNGLRSQMEAEAKRLAPSLSWAAVAAQYVSLADALIRADEAMAM